MAFQPNAGDEITINKTIFRVDEHPAFKEIPYGQEGRQGTVYRLYSLEEPFETKALKVFKPVYHNPMMVYQAEQLENFSGIRGLKACSRYVITPELDTNLMKNQSDLLYAVVMPWIKGPTWLDTLLDQTELTREQSLRIAVQFAQLLSGMEQRGLAHCDLSAPNVLLPCLVQTDKEAALWSLELVDVEQMFGRGLDRPEHLTAGSPGYAPVYKDPAGLWSKYADRFAGAILFAEMLCWFDPQIRKASWGESFFAPDELQQTCERQQLMEHTIHTYWGKEVSGLFMQAWNSHNLNQCPTFGEWLTKLLHLDASAPLVTMPTYPVEGKEPTGEIAFEQPSPSVSEFKGAIPQEQRLISMISQGNQLEQEGNLEGAIDIYRVALMEVPKNSEWEIELLSAITIAEQKLAQPQAPVPEENASQAAAMSSVTEKQVEEMTGANEQTQGEQDSPVRELVSSQVSSDSQKVELPKEVLRPPGADRQQAPAAQLAAKNSKKGLVAAIAAGVIGLGVTGAWLVRGGEEVASVPREQFVNESPTKSLPEQSSHPTAQMSSSNPGATPSPQGDIAESPTPQPTPSSAATDKPSDPGNSASPASSKTPITNMNTTEAKQIATQPSRPVPSVVQSTTSPEVIPAAEVASSPIEEPKASQPQPAPSAESKKEEEFKLTSASGITGNSQFSINSANETIISKLDAFDTASLTLSLNDSYTALRSLVEFTSDDPNGSVTINVFLDNYRPRPTVLNKNQRSARLDIGSNGFQKIKVSITNESNSQATVTLKYPKIVKGG